MLGTGGPGPFGFIVSAIAVIVLAAAWMILASAASFKEDSLERPERVPQLYGYTVCLVTLIWALGSAVTMVENWQTLVSPVYARQNEYGTEPSITSFEAFRLTYDRARLFNAPEQAGALRDSLPESELRKRYGTYRADRIASIEVRARQSLEKTTVSLLLAVALFAFHWRWLRRQRMTAGVVA